MKKNYRPRFGERKGVTYPASGGSRSLARPIPAHLKRNFKQISIGVVIVILSNMMSHGMFNPSWGGKSEEVNALHFENENSLYLIEKAGLFVEDTHSFEEKVREIADMLAVHPSWLMAVMYSESKFDAAVLNHRGSGATGLIQFMPTTAQEMNVSLHRLRRMTHLQQLEYVYQYLQTVRDRYGEFGSLTDLYLAILYPKAIGQDYCYTLYAKPSKSYRQNSGLDENKDGRVTISDIDRRMQRLFKTAYLADK